MIKRPYWLTAITKAWRQRPLVWLSGVRRSGKTSLARMLGDVRYLNCDLPSVVRQLADPEPFMSSCPRGTRLVFDEVHRLADPSRLLKIAADEFPQVRVLATGSSTLAATRKFRDSLTGRKRTLYLPPVLWDECRTDFGIADLDRRLLHGGLPEALLAARPTASFYAEWIDSYYARDIAELFGVRERTGFLTLLRLLLCQSGGLADYTRLAADSGMSRPTVRSHLEAMAVAHAVFALRPFHGGGRRELVHRPKLYAFDTGFVAFANGWREIRDSDRGILWEHLVLDTLRAAGYDDEIQFWRDKSGCELDFVVGHGARVEVIEAKINPDRFNPDALRRFRGYYPDGRNWVISPHTTEPYERRFDSLVVRFIGTGQVLDGCLSPGPRRASR